MMTEQELLESGAEVFFLLFFSDTEEGEILQKCKKFENWSGVKILVQVNQRGNIKLMGTRAALAGFLSCITGKTLVAKLGRFCRHKSLDDGWILPETVTKN